MIVCQCQGSLQSGISALKIMQRPKQFPKTWKKFASDGPEGLPGAPGAASPPLAFKLKSTIGFAVS